MLTMEWIDGIKLTDARRISEASLNKKQLIDQVFMPTISLLCFGFFCLLLSICLLEKWKCRMEKSFVFLVLSNNSCQLQ